MLRGGAPAERLTALGAVGVHLIQSPRNHRAYRFYKRMGFVEVRPKDAACDLAEAICGQSVDAVPVHTPVGVVISGGARRGRADPGASADAAQPTLALARRRYWCRRRRRRSCTDELPTPPMFRGGRGFLWPALDRGAAPRADRENGSWCSSWRLSVCHTGLGAPRDPTASVHSTVSRDWDWACAWVAHVVQLSTAVAGPDRPGVLRTEYLHIRAERRSQAPRSMARALHGHGARGARCSGLGVPYSWGAHGLRPGPRPRPGPGGRGEQKTVAPPN
jgi:hypothetical protein